MTFVCWAAHYEGPSDALYFDSLITRLMDDAIRRNGVRMSTVATSPALLFRRGTDESVAQELCETSDSFYIAFIHSDTGGRNLEGRIGERGGRVCERANELCGWDMHRCVLLTPRHEMEAWALADPDAVCESLGYRGSHEDLGLPSNANQAERLIDPKATLAEAIRRVRGSRRAKMPEYLFPAIAQRQSLTALRGSASFNDFEARLERALRSLGCVH